MHIKSLAQQIKSCSVKSIQNSMQLNCTIPHAFRIVLGSTKRLSVPCWAWGIGTAALVVNQAEKKMSVYNNCL